MDMRFDNADESQEAGFENMRETRHCRAAGTVQLLKRKVSITAPSAAGCCFRLG
jgi:hypothetical protein